MTVYAPTLYPSTAELAGASKVTLKAGEERSDVDIVVPLVPALTLTGLVTTADGRPAGSARVAVVPARPTCRRRLRVSVLESTRRPRRVSAAARALR